MNERYNKCPYCGGKIVGGCRCMRNESTCENGHNFHWCSVHGKLVKGSADHSIPTNVCTCLSNRQQLEFCF